MFGPACYEMVSAQSGAVNPIAAKPRFENSTALSAGYGNHDRFETSGFANVALDEDLAARLAFTYPKADGTLKNRAPGKGDLDAVDEYGLRLLLRYAPTPDAEFLLHMSTSLQHPTNYGVLAEPGPLGIGGGVYAALHDIDPELNPLTDDFRAGLGRREVTRFLIWGPWVRIPRVRHHLSSKSVGSSGDGVSMTSRPRCIAWVIRCARLRALSFSRTFSMCRSTVRGAILISIAICLAEQPTATSSSI